MPRITKRRSSALTGNVEVTLFHEEDYDAVSMRLRIRMDDGFYYAKPVELVFEKYEPGEPRIIEPFMRFDKVSGEQFLDSLAKCLISMGFAPDLVEQMSGELKATKYHLEDMRKLAKVS